LEPLVQCAFDREASMPGHVPVGEQRQLTFEQCPIVGRQHLRPGCQLPPDQGIDGLGIEWSRGLRIGRVDHVEHGLAAEIVEQQEALGFVPLEHLRGGQARVAHQPGDLNEGGAVLLGGGRVHHDARGGVVRRVDAEVAPEARIGRGRAQGRRQQPVPRRDRGEPVRESAGALRIAPADRWGWRRGAAVRGRGSCHG
jgi:hypothetical protein